jgi:hypothetical protein
VLHGLRAATGEERPGWSGLQSRLVRAARWKRNWATQVVRLQNKGKEQGSRWAVAGPNRRKIKKKGAEPARDFRSERLLKWKNPLLFLKHFISCKLF